MAASCRFWLRRPPLKIQGHRALSSSSHQWRWHQLRNLDYASVENFQQQCFLSAAPATLRGAFKEIPAKEKWFSHSGAASSLQREYLQPHEATLLPMELTRKSGKEVTFNKADAPLSLLLRWENVSNSEDFCRLYIAQAPLVSLPEELQMDLPVPQLVSKAGKGDVYDANLWMGFSPTYTPLHKDPNPNLFVQLAGSKNVRIMAPEKGEAVFSSVQRTLGKAASASFRENEMMQGQERELLERFVWGESSESDVEGIPFGFEAELREGDGIFIPKGWWHSIKGTSTGIIASVCIHTTLSLCD